MVLFMIRFGTDVFKLLREHSMNLGSCSIGIDYLVFSSVIYNGNCTEWSAIWAETIRVIFKIERARSASSI